MTIVEKKGPWFSGESIDVLEEKRSFARKFVCSVGKKPAFYCVNITTKRTPSIMRHERTKTPKEKEQKDNPSS